MPSTSAAGLILFLSIPFYEERFTLETSTFYVSLSMQDAVSVIDNEIIKGNVSGTLTDRFVINHPDGKHCLLSVYEKHFARAGSRLTLTVTLDNFFGHTRVHTTGSGGGGLLRIDFGAASAFTQSVVRALSPFMVQI